MRKYHAHLKWRGHLLQDRARDMARRHREVLRSNLYRWKRGVQLAIEARMRAAEQALLGLLSDEGEFGAARKYYQTRLLLRCLSTCLLYTYPSPRDYA